VKMARRILRALGVILFAWLVAFAFSVAAIWRAVTGRDAS